MQLKKHARPGGSADSALKGQRPVYFPDVGYRDVPVYDRERFTAGMTFSGPAIVEERESTAVIWPGDRARIDDYLAMVVEIEGENR